MSNYIEYNNKIAFHPGYYIKEIIDESGLSQQDFAQRLNTTPKNLSLLIRGEQSLSIDIAMKLSRMLGTSLTYWLNLQNAFDILQAEFSFEKELILEKEILSTLGYNYFKDNFNLPNLPRNTNEQVNEVRKFLKVASLTVLTKKDIAISYRSATKELNNSSTIKSNTMVQIAINKALETKAPKFNKDKFEKAYKYALTLTGDHDNFYSIIKKEFENAGVIIIVLPNIPGSNINGATKKIGNNIMLMVNDRGTFADTFWFTLYHEIGHIVNGDYGISFDKEVGEKEEKADLFAQNTLIHTENYYDFINKKKFDKASIISFAKSINRDPGIILGRLRNDGLVDYNNYELNCLRHKYKITIS